MTTVDPYVVTIPSFVANSGDEELISWFVYDNRWKHDIWIKTGGGVDTISSSVDEASANENQITQLYGLVADLQASLQRLEADIEPQVQANEIRTKTITSDYTAVDRDFINAKNNATITFPAYPAENAVIIVRNGDGSNIALSGNGKRVNGSLTGAIRTEGTSIEFHYFVDSDEWFAR